MALVILQVYCLQRRLLYHNMVIYRPQSSNMCCGGIIGVYIPQASYSRRIYKGEIYSYRLAVSTDINCFQACILCLYSSGNLLIISSSSSCVLALTWGGVRYPWSSVHVLTPLIVGLAGMGFFLFYEARFAKEPIVSRVTEMELN